MDNQIILSNIKSSLPALMQKTAFDKLNNMVVTDGVTSDCAHYFQGCLISGSFAIVFNLAQGHTHKFLNGVLLFGSNGKKGAVLLDSHILPMFEGWFWSEQNGKILACGVLKRFIENQCTVLGLPKPSDNQLDSLARDLYAEAQCMTREAGNMLVQQSGVRCLS